MVKPKYKPKLNINDILIDENDNTIGIIRNIDSILNRHYNFNYMPEYYVEWPDGSWTRYDCINIDEGIEPRVRKANKTERILYGV